MEKTGVKNDFLGKTAVIVGGTSGIGREVAKELSFHGARTFVVARHPSDGISFAKFIKCDVRREEDVRNLVEEVIAQEKRIDILVNAMAINQCKLIEEISLTDWEDVMAVNITGIFLVCKMVLPHMKRFRSGKIVNISSIAGRHRSPVAGVHYVASKAAIIGFSKQLAYEAASFGINVNVLCPGQTMTPMLKKGMSQEQIERLESMIPLRRIASVEEQAGPVLFLCSDAASYLSGAVLDVNGGQI